jgi:hypothetical protein
MKSILALGIAALLCVGAMVAEAAQAVAGDHREDRPYRARSRVHSGDRSPLPIAGMLRAGVMIDVDQPALQDGVCATRLVITTASGMWTGGTFKSA